MIATVAVSLVGFLVLAAAGALAYRAMCQRRIARSLAILIPKRNFRKPLRPDQWH